MRIHKRPIWLSVMCACLLAACSMPPILPQEPKPNAGLDYKSDRKLAVRIEPRIPDSMLWCSECSASIIRWRFALVTGFKNAFGDNYILTTAESADFVIDIEQAVWSTEKANTYHVGMIDYRARLLNKQGKSVRATRDKAIARVEWDLLSFHSEEANQGSGSAIEVMWEQIGKELLGTRPPEVEDGGVLANKGRAQITPQEQAAADAKSDAEYPAASKAGTIDALSTFLERNPGPRHRTDALIALGATASREPDKYSKYSALIERFPDFIAAMPESDRVMIIGPEGLKIYEVLNLLKQGMGPETLRAKIGASERPYKVFTNPEAIQLNRAGLPDSIIAAMIQTTADFNRAQKAHQEQAESKAEIAKLQAQVQALQTQQAEGTAAPAAGEGTAGGSSLGDVAASCVKRRAAVQACSRLPFGASICQAAAESNFSCPIQ